MKRLNLSLISWFSLFLVDSVYTLSYAFLENIKKHILQLRVIGQKELVKTAVVVENSTATAVISFLKEDTGWTKRVGKIA